MEKTVIAETEEHRSLLAEGWKPTMAYQGFERIELFNKLNGGSAGSELKPRTALYIVMRLE